MRVFVCQVRVTDDESAEARAERVFDLVRNLERPDLVVLPELWLHGGFNYDGWGEGIERDDPVLQELAALANELECYIHAGSVVLKASQPGNRPTNTALLYGPDGSLVSSYDKIHLFGFDKGEAVEFQAGDTPVATEIRGIPVGLAICFDLRFPELFRELSDAGSKLLIVPSAWPDRRTEHWRALLRARAIESQCYVLAAATAGTHAKLTMSGYSAIIDPSGIVLAEAGASTDETLFAEIEESTVDDLRSEFPVLNWQRLRKLNAQES